MGGEIEAQEGEAAGGEMHSLSVGEPGRPAQKLVPLPCSTVCLSAAASLVMPPKEGSQGRGF